MNNLAVVFKGASDKTFYKVLAALASMNWKEIEKVKFSERFDIGWVGEVHFLSKEAMEIFGNKIRDRSKRRY